MTDELFEGIELEDDVKNALSDKVKQAIKNKWEGM